MCPCSSNRWFDNLALSHKSRLVDFTASDLNTFDYESYNGDRKGVHVADSVDAVGAMSLETEAAIGNTSEGRNSNFGISDSLTEGGYDMAGSPVISDNICQYRR